MQDRVKRTAANRGMGYQPISPWNAEIPHQRCIRVGTSSCFAVSLFLMLDHFKILDWLRDKRFFDGMEHDDAFAKERLGFAAPNVLVMSLIS